MSRGRFPETAWFRGRRLCVVGNVNRDLRIAPVSPGDWLFEDGETSTDFVRETVGGGGANSALFAATLGAAVNFAGKVGADPLGERLRRTLKRAGVRPFLAVDPRHLTGTSVNLVYSTGHRHFVSSLPSSATLTVRDIERAAMKGCGHLLRADVWFSEPMLFGGNEKLLAAAKDAGITTSVDVNWDPLWGKAPARKVAERKRALRKVLPLVDVVHGNVRELCAFTDAAGLPGALRAVGRWGAGAVVVHMGKRGAGYFERGTLVTSPCVRAARVVNAAGTGDLLSVIMILLDGREGDVREKLRTANRVVSDYVAGRGLFAAERGAIA